MSPDAPDRARVLAKLAATIVLAGALVAGMLLPFVGGTGLAARNSASLLDALPVELTDETPAGNTRVLAADGSLITNFYRDNRTPVPSDRIAPVMKQALVAIEDSRFEVHNGLDVQGTLRALATNVAAGSVQEGGSTLTQQLVKQTLAQTADTAEERQAATEESVGRKLREARMALALEEEYSKDEILTRYLNLVYFGQGAYGVQAARHGGGVPKGQIPRPLPQPRVLRTGRRRLAGRGAALLTRRRRAPAPAPGAHAPRPGAEPAQQRPGPQPGNRVLPPQPGAA